LVNCGGDQTLGRREWIGLATVDICCSKSIGVRVHGIAMSYAANAELEYGTFAALMNPKQKMVPPGLESLPPYVNFAPLDNAADELTRSAEGYETALLASGDRVPASLIQWPMCGGIASLQI